MSQLQQHTLQNLLHNWIGLDYILDRPNHTASTFPPYDIIKQDNKYTIAIALAGYGADDIDIHLVGETLKIVSKPDNTPTKDVEYVHKGIAKRAFKLSFNLSPEIDVDGSKFENGMLYITMHRVVPPTDVPKRIVIES